MAGLQFYRKTAATWTTDNTVLDAGRPGFETDTGRFKIGDGTTAWNALAYQGAQAGTNEQTGTAYTLAFTDLGKRVKMNNGSAQTLTIPTNASVAFPVGSIILAQQFGAGVLSVAGDTGVTLNGVSAGSGDISVQYGMVTLFKDATDVWTASGAIGTVA